jgi:hypothetical protein
VWPSLVAFGSDAKYLARSGERRPPRNQPRAHSVLDLSFAVQLEAHPASCDTAHFVQFPESRSGMPSKIVSYQRPIDCFRGERPINRASQSESGCSADLAPEWGTLLRTSHGTARGYVGRGPMAS